MSDTGRQDSFTDGAGNPLTRAANYTIETAHFLAALGLVIAGMEWIATKLKASREVLAASTPFNSVVIPPRDPYELAAVVGAYCVLLAFAAGVAALVYLRGYIWGIGLRPGQWIARTFDLIGESYLGRHYAGILHVQFGLRMLLVLTVLISALTSLGHRIDPRAPEAIQLVKICNIAQIYICAAFLLYSVVRHFLYDAKQLSKLQTQYTEKRAGAEKDWQKLQKIEEESDEQASAVFFRIGWIDIVVISLIWCLTLLPDKEFYLAYMLPLAGVWLVERKDQSVGMIWAVVILVVLRGALVMSLRIYEPQLSAALGITRGDRLWLYAGSIIPKFALLAAVAFLAVTLRHVHLKLRSRIADTLDLLKSATDQVVTREAEAAKLKTCLDEAMTKAKTLVGDFGKAQQDWQSLNDALTALGARFDDTQQRLSTAEQHALLQSALAKLSDREGHAVFIKDIHRRFVYANDDFLRLITPTLHENAVLARDEKPHLLRVQPGAPIRLEDIRGRNDREIGIETQEYIDSDNAVLGLPDSAIPNDADRLYKPNRSSDHFEGAERGFSDPQGSTPRFWTIKQALRDEREPDKVWGLVGEVLHGEQEFVRRLSPKLLDEFPLFVSVKEPDGHVIYMNRAMLDRMSPKLKECAENSSGFDKTPDKLLATIGRRRGPTDTDLYGRELAEEYRQIDQELKRVADEFIGWMNEKTGNNRLALNSPEAQAELTRRLSMIEPIRSKGVHNYPQDGWIEFHRFPKEKSGSWVEVRKLPIIQETQRGAEVVLEYKGILVVFQDVTPMYLRRCSDWHWVEEHFRNARRASVYKPKSKLGLSDPKSLPLLSLLQAMLRWLRRAIDGGQLELQKMPHEISELQTILALTEDMYDSKVKVELNVAESVPSCLPRAGYFFFGVVLALTMNAIEARLRAKREGRVADDEGAPVRISLTRKTNETTDRLLLVVEDPVAGLESETIARINAREMLRHCEQTGRKLPGGGLLLADRLARELSATPSQLSLRAGGGSIATFEVDTASLGLTRASLSFPRRDSDPEYSV